MRNLFGLLFQIFFKSKTWLFCSLLNLFGLTSINWGAGFCIHLCLIVCVVLGGAVRTRMWLCVRTCNSVSMSHLFPSIALLVRVLFIHSVMFCSWYRLGVAYWGWVVSFLKGLVVQCFVMH